MFGFFREKTLDLIAANIVSTLNFQLGLIPINSPHNELPETMLDDRFFLGYVLGLTKAGMYCTGVTSVKHCTFVTWRVFEYLFPKSFQGALPKVAKQCAEWSVNKDEIFTNALLIAIDESSGFFKALMAKKQDAANASVASMKSLKLHIQNNYPNVGGTDFFE